MTSSTATPSAASAGAAPQSDAFKLRLSDQLAQVPAERVAPAPTPAPSTAPAATAAVALPVVATTPAAPVLALPPVSSTPPITWLFLSAALLGGAGWLIERRKRLLLETEKDSVLWADVQVKPGPSAMDTHQQLDDILPDNDNAAEKARSIYVTAIGETTSRREATLIDLHQLDGKITRRRARGDTFDAVLLLQQHLIDFRYTSPWAFLELRELYKTLGRQKEWEVSRQAFSTRFGQNAPAWDAPSTVTASLSDDRHLGRELESLWPYRESRMFVLRWMLGDPTVRRKAMGPPLLPLGIYRDLLLLDSMLDDVIRAKQDRVDTDLAGLEITE